MGLGIWIWGGGTECGRAGVGGDVPWHARGEQRDELCDDARGLEVGFEAVDLSVSARG